MLDNTNACPQWNLRDLYISPTSEQFSKDFKTLESDVDNFEVTYKGNILGHDSNYDCLLYTSPSPRD